MEKTPRICLFDIETAPSLGYFWGKLWETDIIKVNEAWYMLCFSYKWLGEKKIYTKALCDYPLYQENLNNDFFLVKDLHKIFDEADILIAHNGDRFDIRKTNARFIKYGMKPPMPYKTIDTLKAARKHFQFESSRLNDLGQYLGFGKKLPTTGFDLWERAMKGDLKAWQLMKRYNQRDVVLLEKVYNEFKPWMTTHPNVQLYNQKTTLICPTCGSNNVTRNGQHYMVSGVYQQHHCKSCGHWFKGDLIRTLHAVMTAAQKKTAEDQKKYPCPKCNSPYTTGYGSKKLKTGRVPKRLCRTCRHQYYLHNLTKT